MTRDLTKPRGDWMQTFTGRAFFPLDPSAEDIDEVDIAHALSLLCRYGGHSSRFYSVAEHCILVSLAVSPENALWGLLHDATEAYMGDLIRPLKRQMPDYATAEDHLMAFICLKFGLPLRCPDEVKDADNRILRNERDVLLGTPPLPWVSIEDKESLTLAVDGRTPVPISCWSPEEAEQRYLARLRYLMAVAGQ